MSVPDPSTGAGSDDGSVDLHLRRTFWGLVLVFNLALLLVSVGVMVVAFQRRWELGLVLVGVGLAAFSAGYRIYRRMRSN